VVAFQAASTLDGRAVGGGLWVRDRRGGGGTAGGSMAGRKLERAAQELRGRAEQAVQNAAALCALCAWCSKVDWRQQSPKGKVGTLNSAQLKRGTLQSIASTLRQHESQDKLPLALKST